jgi:FkbM family methyltransferase
MVQWRSTTVNQRVHNFIVWTLKQSPFLGRRNFHRYNSLRRGGQDRVDAESYFGARFYDCDIQDKISRFIFNYGIWEPNISDQFEEILKPGDVVVDIGANIGYYSLLSSALVEQSGRVVSIEASPTIFRQLSENIAGNDATNVRAVNVAASDKAGKLTLYGGPEANRGATSTLPREGLSPESEVAAAPLEDILTAEERAAATLIKIDVEGAELPILEHLVDRIELYSSNVKVLVEMTPAWAGPERSEKVFQRFLAAGFDAYAIENAYSDEYYFNWKQPAPVTRIWSLPVDQVDVLFTRRA